MMANHPRMHDNDSTELGSSTPLIQAALALLVAGTLVAFSALAFSTGFAENRGRGVVAASDIGRAGGAVVLPALGASAAIEEPRRTTESSTRVAITEATDEPVVLGTRVDDATTRTTQVRHDNDGVTRTVQVRHDDCRGRGRGHEKARGRGHHKDGGKSNHDDDGSGVCEDLAAREEDDGDGDDHEDDEDDRDDSSHDSRSGSGRGDRSGTRRRDSGPAQRKFDLAQSRGWVGLAAFEAAHQFLLDPIQDLLKRPTSD